ncbi:hypothetical protein Tco_0656536 [Tanacetum coccineum]|uniref:Uncharacterized protein n=1 Tax=Tanacetum coccineum TaxID=301880 RepID=A0ABQ4XAB4_9ASTR
MDMEHGSEKMKSPEKIEEEEVDTQKEMKEVVKESGAKRKKSLPRKRRTVKRQKLEEDAEKEELWSLCDLCGVHILLMQNGIAIHMLTEKKYPLSQEMISKMLSKRLEVDQESTQAYELLKFIRSQVKK